MENKQYYSSQEIIEKQNHLCFQSFEHMKVYYLQMCNIFTPNQLLVERSDYSRLKNLYRKIKQFSSCIQNLGDHPWEKGITEIQSTCGIYMMQNNIDPQNRIRTNQEIGHHLQFITLMATNTNLYKQLQGIFSYHLANVQHLLLEIENESH